MLQVGHSVTPMVTTPTTPEFAATQSPQQTVRSSGSPVSRALPLLVDADLELRGVLGEGGMGRVVLARQRSMERDVAVKTPLADSSAATHAALVAEGTLTGQLEHPAIVPVHALGLDASGTPAMVMKRVDGVSWDTLINDPAHPGWEGWEGVEADRLPGHLQLLGVVCNALHFAHSRGVVHRDVKPQNVLIGRYGDVYLADWGVATTSGEKQSTITGTPAFMAPEMVASEVVDARTDVYLLGATLHTVLTGLPRHPGSTVTDALVHARRSPAFEYEASVPVELAALCNAACDADPAKRPPTARAFRDALADYVRHRDARALADPSALRVEELERLAAVTQQLDASDRQRLERLSSEARFGLEQSLRQWPANERAQHALARVEAVMQARERRAAALEAQSRDHNPNLGANERTVALTVLMVLGLMTAVLDRLIPAQTPFKLVALPGFIFAGMMSSVLLLRRGLLATLFNRQVFACVAICLGSLCLTRVVDELTHEHHLARDCFMQAAVMSVCATLFLRWTWSVVAVFVGTGVLCLAFPAGALDVFGWGMVTVAAVSALGSWWDHRRRQVS